MTSKQSSETGSDRIFLWFGLDVSKNSFTAAFHNGIDGKTIVKSGNGFTPDPAGVRQFLKWRGTVLKENLGEMAFPVRRQIIVPEIAPYKRPGILTVPD